MTPPTDLTALSQVLERAERACRDDNTDAALDYVRDALRHVAALAGAETPQGMEPPCPFCGKHDSPDGDWYRVCGPCRWNAAPPPAVAPAALVAPATDDALRAVWGDIVVRWNAMITAKLNYPTSGDLLTVMGHVNDAFREALSLPLPESPDAAAPPVAAPDCDCDAALQAAAQAALADATRERDALKAQAHHA